MIKWPQLGLDSKPKSVMIHKNTVYHKKYAHGFCFAVLCCGYTLTDFPISIRLTSLALWHSNDCHSASIATLMNMDKYFMWIHYEWLHNHNKAKHSKTVCTFLEIYCNLKQWHMGHTSDLMMIIRSHTSILTLIIRETGKLNTQSPIYCMQNKWNWLNLRYTRQNVPGKLCRSSIPDTSA